MSVLNVLMVIVVCLVVSGSLVDGKKKKKTMDCDSKNIFILELLCFNFSVNFYGNVN